MADIFQLILDIISFLMYIFDVVSDILLAISFKENGDVWYFSLTLTFVLLSAVITNIISYCELPSFSGRFWLWEFDDPASEINTTLRIIIHICLLGMVFRYSSVIFCAGSFYEDSTSPVIVLCLLEIFFEAAPQLILQLYIIIANMQVIRPEIQTYPHFGISKRNATALVTEDNFFRELSSITMIYQVVSIAASISSIAWILTKFLKVAISNTDVYKMSWSSIGFYFLWHEFKIGARIFALALFTSVFTFWSFVVIGLHSLIIGLYFTRKGERSCARFCKNVFIGLMFSFSNFGVESEPTKDQYFIYFVFEIIEDSILVAFWSWGTDFAANTFLYFGLVIYFGCAVLGFLFMQIYLHCFHSASKRDIVGINERKSKSTIAELEPTFTATESE